MFQSIPGLGTVILTVVLIVGPFIFTEARKVRRSSSQNAPLPTPAANRLQWLVVALVVSHTVYIGYKMIVHPPQNIFSILRVSVTTPSETLRTMLLRRAQPPVDHLSAPMEELLIRLSSFDVRTLYIRLGHDVVQSCEHCTTANEFNIVALPTALTEYIFEALLAGALTSRGLHKRHWRPWVVGALAVVALFERYILAAVNIKMPSTGVGVTMWHDNMWYCRQFLFALAPIFAILLPNKPPQPSVLTRLENTKSSLESIARNLKLLDIYRLAAVRTPEFREQLVDYWANEQREGDWALNDRVVQYQTEKFDLGIRPGGRLQQNAKDAVRTQLDPVIFSK